MGFSVIEEARSANKTHDSDRWINHGGVAVIARHSYRLTKFGIGETFKTFEWIGCRVSSGDMSFTLLTIHRPGSKQPTPAFSSEIMALLERVMSRAGHVFIVGDINIRFDRQSDEHAIRFTSILTDFGCGQWINMPTHDDDGWLDVMISREEDGPLDTEVIDVGRLIIDSFVLA